MSSEKRETKSKKESESSSFGVYRKDGDSLQKIQAGFCNAVSCERWIKKNVEQLGIPEGEKLEFAILSLRKSFTLRVETKHTVYIDEAL